MATGIVLWLPLSVLFLGSGMGGDEVGVGGDGTRIKQIKRIDMDFLSFESLHGATVYSGKYSQRLSVRSASSAFHPLREIYTAEVGVREATGNNDGPRIAEYLRYCGLGEGYEWCAAFVSWCHGQAGYPEPRNAWAAALFPAGHMVWTRASEGTGDAARNTRASSNAIPRQGDVFSIYSTSKERIAHCGFVDGWDGKFCLTVEGNVDNAVVGKRRPIKTIYAVSRWH
ncbi:CHAP domain-containing protein [Parapedobacter tibetensis]|uniref:CHAP domain-containing protein n=1 Tax=Parapedobacter tibetensis TaxID=2972951 RepID=UPI00214D9FDD|nr:CHAP domain-containing protein [Parapedobacter tibetensis]